MTVKDMDFEGPPSDHFAVVLQQGLKTFHIVFDLVIPQEAPNHDDKVVPRYFIRSRDILGGILAPYDFLYFWSDKNTGFEFC